ncbi:hypothetical protein EDD18DRAFT_1129814 [Armillaria luteobubalina]|uniref:F-box domain-containing protein n=1 Tax=Armillaria luteobubalina TaxID=153913 RepID=A0AA39QMD1_9AGAR|nr:hypothetical protein EDD18DRAFT_1129814 [Armillaria luteobubalina]
MTTTACGRLCPQCGFAPSESPLPDGISAARVQEMVFCNDAPVGTERTELEAVVREGERYLALLQQRISLTRNTLESLLEEQNRAVKHISDSKSVLNPVRRLPSEILSHIFRSCLPWDGLLYPSTDVQETITLLDSLNIKNPPWNLSYVSSQWRQAALTTPGLWSYIQLQLRRYKGRRTSLYRLVTYLERSGTQNLTVVIESDRDMSDHPILPVILSTSPRWNGLFVKLPFSALHIFRNVSGSLGALKWLGVRLGGEPIEPVTTIEAFRFAPQLRELRLMGWNSAICFHDLFHLPWDQITEATVQGNNIQSLAVLRKAPNLRYGVFAACKDLLPDAPSELCRHAHLQMLVIATGPESSSEFIAELLSGLALPRLLELWMAFSDTKEDIVFPKFTSETAPMLENLCIDLDYSKTLNSQMLTSLLKHTPFLKRLKLSAKVTTDDVFLQLGIKTDFSQFVPQLQGIDLTGTTFEFEHASSIFSGMVASRREAVDGTRTFKTLILDEPLDFDDDNLSARWERLCLDGLDVQYGAGKELEGFSF